MDHNIKVSNSNQNGDYYLKVLKAERDKLEILVNKSERELENGKNISEEASGKLRIAAGKAKLLMCKKFCQFEELCHRSMDSSGKQQFFTVTAEDLAGYWDVVMIQISQIHSIFEQSFQLIDQALPKLK